MSHLSSPSARTYQVTGEASETEHCWLTEQLLLTLTPMERQTSPNRISLCYCIMRLQEGLWLKSKTALTDSSTDSVFLSVCLLEPSTTAWKAGLCFICWFLLKMGRKSIYPCPRLTGSNFRSNIWQHISSNSDSSSVGSARGGAIFIHIPADWWKNRKLIKRHIADVNNSNIFFYLGFSVF